METKRIINKIDYTKKSILRIMKVSSRKDYFIYENMISECFKELKDRFRKHDVLLGNDNGGKSAL